MNAAPNDAAALYRALFETAPDAMVVVDADGRIVLANPQAARLFGYGDDELLGQPVEVLLPENARGGHSRHRTHYMERPRVRPMGAGQELVGRRRDGAEFPVEIALSPIAGERTTLFAASIRDISETQRQRQALIRSRYDAFVANIGQLALTTSSFESFADRVAVLVTEALDVAAAGVVLVQPSRGEFFASAPGLDTDLAADAFRAVRLDDAETKAYPLGPDALAHVACLAAGIDGGRVAPILDMTKPIGALVVLTRSSVALDRDAGHFLDIVANMLATAALRHHAQEQLAHAQRLEAVGQLTGGIAHDFNNLLTVISGNLQLLETELAENPDAADVIARALRAVGRGAELTRKLLAFARRQRLTPTAIAPRKLLDELAVMLQRTLGETIRVHVDRGDVAGTMSPVFADPSQLEGALLNLALNARDAMPRGGRLDLAAQAVDVEAAAASDELPAGSYVAFSVSDTGLGMPPEVLARAFEPFFTTKESGKGSGLGLSMVYGFVKQSGGHLSAKSRLGYGTRVELYLPAAPSNAARPAETARIATRRGDETVLVVEDEPEVRGIAVVFLRSLGYSVHEAGDAGEALAILRATPAVALLFSDVVLGSGPNGVELAHAALEHRADLAILLTSGYERVSGDTPNDFPLLRKPYRKEDLAYAVRGALDRAT